MCSFMPIVSPTQQKVILRMFSVVLTQPPPLFIKLMMSEQGNHRGGTFKKVYFLYCNIFASHGFCVHCGSRIDTKPVACDDDIAVLCINIYKTFLYESIIRQSVFVLIITVRNPSLFLSVKMCINIYKTFLKKQFIVPDKI